MVLAAVSFESIMSGIVNAMFWGAPVILFLVFLVLFIINLIKLKKGSGKKGKTIVFGVLSAVFLTYTIGEVLIVAMLAAAVAHM